MKTLQGIPFSISIILSLGTAASLGFSGISFPSFGPGCIRGEAEYRAGCTNFARCGYVGFDDGSATVFDKRYAENELTAYRLKEPVGQSSKLWTNYSRSVLSLGYGSVEDCLTEPTNWCPQVTGTNFTAWIPCDDPNTCEGDFNHLFENLPRWTGSSLPDGYTNILSVQNGHYRQEQVTEYGQWNDAGTFAGRETFVGETRMLQAEYLTTFANDALAGARSRVTNGSVSSWLSVFLATSCCDDEFALVNRKEEIGACLGQYRIKFVGQAGIEYDVSWTVRKIYSVPQRPPEIIGGGARRVTATGVTNYVGGEGGWFDAPEPGLEEQFGIEVIDIQVKPVGGGCGDTCTTMGGPEPGDGTDHLPPTFWIGLGAGNIDSQAGALALKRELPAAELATIGALDFNINSSVVTLVTNAGDGSIDVQAPTMMARVVTSNDYSYWVHCFPKVGGAYDTNSAFIRHLIVNPNGSTNFNTLRHIRFLSAGAITNEFVCETNNSTNLTWRLVSGNGLKGQRLAKITNPDQTWQEQYSVFNPANQQEVYRRHALYRSTFAGDALLSEIVDPSGAALVTTNTFDSDGRLLGSIKSDGSWVVHEYDTNGFLVQSVYPIMNEAPGTDPGDCRTLSFDYATLGSPDNTNSEPAAPRTITERVNGMVVAKTMYAYSGNDVWVQTAANPDTGWGNSANEISHSQHDTQNRLTGSDHPDGTRTTNTYSDSASGRLITTWSGAHSSGTFYQGTKTVVGLDTLGRMVGQTNFDIASGEILSQQVYSEPDTFGRPTKSTYLDGTSSVEVRQGCCQAAYSIDRDGVASTNSYDALNRLISTVRLKITNSIVYDAADRPLVHLRRGTNGNSIVQRGLAYDLAGRVIRETNALQGVTTFSNYLDASSRWVKITTNPDTGVRTEVFYRSGDIASITNSAAFPVRYEYGEELEGDYRRRFTKQIKLNKDSTDTSEWTKTYLDGLGRSYKMLFPGDSEPYRQSFFNAKGQLWKERDPDGVITLYGYNAISERSYSAIDSNRNDVIDFNGMDRITLTTNDVVSAHGTVVRRARTFAWGTNDNSTATLLTTSEVSTNGLQTWQTVHDGGGSVVTSTETQIPTSANAWTRTITQTMPDNSTIVSVSQFGRLLSVTRRDSTGAQIGATTYSYDAHGRQSAIIDARNGATSFTFNNADQVVTVTTPPVAGGLGSFAPQVTTTFYDKMLRATGSLLPDGTVVTNEFYLNGLRQKTWGSRTYPVEYTYDSAGRMSTMKTWQNFAANSGSAVTTWKYNERGWLTNKLYADNHGPTYSYTAAGRLDTRYWARTNDNMSDRPLTDYGYNDAGEMDNLYYDDDLTPITVYSLDRRGRVVGMDYSSGSAFTTLVYSEGGLLLSENYSGGTLDGLSVTNRYDSLLRRTNVSVKNGSTVLASTGYSYDSASRLANVTDGTNSAAYSYIANSPLVGQILFQNNGTTRMTTTKQYDALNRLSAIVNQPSADSAVSFAYDYNSANQRTRVTLADGSYWLYTYDALGQVTSGRKYWGDGSLVAGQQFDYAFDDIGNRKQTKAGGDEHGNGKRVANYTVNDLNQYTQREVPGAFDVLGVARGTVTVNGSGSGVHRKTEYFRKELSVNNSSAPQYQTVDVTATDGTSLTETGGVYVAKTPEAFGYDMDGNMTNDGRWILKWDAENRLIEAKTISGVPLAAERRLVFEYDNQSRRIRKTVYDRAESGTLLSDQKFVYDRWNLLAILDGDNALQQSYRWGTDLSGTMQGAGGVGGLLSVTIHTGTNTGVSFCGYDGNGNVAALISVVAGANIGAYYEYDLFHRVLRATGPWAFASPFLGATKFFDWETGLYYYGYRFHDPSTGRWLSRDPLEEEGSLNLYNFILNAPNMLIDLLGLEDLPIYVPPYEFPFPGGPGRPTVPVITREDDSYSCGGSKRRTSLLTLTWNAERWVPKGKIPSVVFEWEPVTYNDRIRIDYTANCDPKAGATIEDATFSWDTPPEWLEGPSDISVPLGSGARVSLGRGLTLSHTRKSHSKLCLVGTGTYHWEEWKFRIIETGSFGVGYKIFYIKGPTSEKVVAEGTVWLSANCCCNCPPK